MARRVHVLGYTWREGQPCLRILEEDQRSNLPLVGDIDWLVTPERRCIGRREEGVPRSCPTGDVPRGSGHCERCQWADGFRVCMICTGFNCPSLPPAMHEKCQSQHVLYLASFGDDRVKVGTAVWHRRDGRLHDQGPLAALRVASAEGPVIKQMEHVLVKAGFTEAFRREDKRRLLASATSPQDALAGLHAEARRLPELLSSSYHAALGIEIVPLPDLAIRTRDRYAARDLLDASPGCRRTGSIVGAVGHLLAVEDEAGVFYLDLAGLKARVIDLAPSSREGRRSRVQLSLF